MELSTDRCMITGAAKLYYSALVTSPVIIRFLRNVFLAIVPHAMWRLQAKDIKKNILNVDDS